MVGPGATTRLTADPTLAQPVEVFNTVTVPLYVPAATVPGMVIAIGEAGERGIYDI